jgi:RHS repeat-associated protein
VAKTANSVTTTYLVDDLNPTGYPQVMDEIVGGVVKREYTYGLQRISENQNPTGAWTPNFYGYDGAESVRYLTSTTGAVTDTYGYDAFGNEVDHTGTTPNNYLYRGEQWDPDLSLYYLRARYMNPLTGRFLSRDPEDGDPASPASLHKYLYTEADPVNLVDPSGRATVEIPKSLVILTLAAFTGLEVLKGGLNCAYNQEGTNTSATLYGGTYAQTAQIGPCTWVGYTRPPEPWPYPGQWPYPLPPWLPVPGTPNPNPPNCRQLNDDVDAAKDTVKKAGGQCRAGDTPVELGAKYAAYLALGLARSIENATCWNGGNWDHQNEAAEAFRLAGNCAALMK